ncbi:MAG: GGDEF domain-containing protein [Sphingomonadaceae bacterium]|nr:GGDEF domain-containing protein [Sphingomonadaceae bacterium]
MLISALFAPAPIGTILVVVGVAFVSLTFLASMIFARAAVEDIQAKVALAEKAQESQFRIEELFAMTDMLQAAEDHEDAGTILEATSSRLLPQFSGALYVFNNSRDRLDLAKEWNVCAGFEPAETLIPGNCWALKRGKPHINDGGTHTLCCMHHIGTAATVEVPMIARGQVHGLLMLAIDEQGAFDKLMAVRRVGRALADSMSLALSNITLREKLRTQSMRDPLTGLYNRRYMEDALDRLISLSERTGSATSVLMIDLDNFKRLNDENGHAKGDAVLRDVAGQLVSELRPSDVVCRYGGEELVVILPNCDLDDARLKAEKLRTRIEALSEAHGAEITASIGIAAVPETATGTVDVIPMADAALYCAKQAGKNRVVCSERRVGKDDSRPRLAVG